MSNYNYKVHTSKITQLIQYIVHTIKTTKYTHIHITLFHCKYCATFHFNSQFISLFRFKSILLFFFFNKTIFISQTCATHFASLLPLRNSIRFTSCENYYFVTLLYISLFPFLFTFAALSSLFPPFFIDLFVFVSDLFCL